MKKLYLLISIFLSLGIVTNSCMYDKIDDVNGEGPGTGPGSVDPDEKIYFVRLTLSPMTGNPRFDMDWANYRDVGIFINNSGSAPLRSNKKFDILEESGTKTVLLMDTVSSPDPDGSGVAYAPYKDSDVSGTVISGILANVQNQKVDHEVGNMDASIGNNMILVADPALFKLDQGTCPFVLKNVFSLLRIRVIKSQSLGMNNRTVKNIKLYVVADEKDLSQPVKTHTLSGSYRLDLSSNPAAPEFTAPLYDITAAIDGYSTIGNYQANWYIYIAVNPFTLSSNERLVAKIETNGGDVIYSPFNNLRSVVGNNVYDCVLTALEENTYLEQINDQYFNAYSNSYIITQKGKYIFPADKTISGKLLSGGRKVEWLWASKEGGGSSFRISDLIDPSTIVYDGSRIIFQVGDNNPFSTMQKGNVILALKDDNNNIVWTWHIWITDRPKDVEYDSSPNTYLLDRNIGALSADTLAPAVDTYGFVYQWGRKDPFFGGDGLIPDEGIGLLSVAGAHTILNGGATWGADVEKWFQIASTATVGTVNESIKYPMRFIYNDAFSSEEDPADWLSVSNQDLWSDKRKTDYDPCPYGYRVPGIDELMTVLYAPWLNYDHYMKGEGAPRPVTGFYNMGNSNTYWIYNRFFTPGSSSMWPLAGLRQGRDATGNIWYGAQLKYSGTDKNMGRGYYWTSTPLKITGVPPGASYRMEMRNNILYSRDTYGPNADAYPVRCVKTTN